MPLEQLDLFEMEMSASEARFRRFGFEPEYGESYYIKAKEAKVDGYRVVRAISATGMLVNYDDESIALANAWIRSERQLGDQDGDDGYAEIIEIDNSHIQKIDIVEPFHFETKIGSPYRIEMYKNADTTKETVWKSCFYRGMTINGKLILVDFGNGNEIIICKKDEIKGFYPLSLEEPNKPLPQEEEEI